MTRARVVHRHRGIAAVAMVAMLLVAEVIIVTMVLSGTRDHDLTMRRLDTVRAFYAAEAGMNMAVRELVANSDEDTDGTVGSISDDGNDANNPSFGEASVLVEADTVVDQIILTSHGTAGEARRRMQATLE